MIGLVLVVLLAVWWLSDGPAGALDEEDDLRPVRHELADEENGWIALLKAGEVLRWPDELRKRTGHFAAAETWDEERVARLLRENEEALRQLQVATRLERVQVPAPESFDDDTDYLEDWRRLATLALIRAEDLFRRGAEEEAFEAAIDVVRLGHTLQDSGGTVIHFLVASAIRSLAFDKIQELTARTALPPEALGVWIRKLEPYGTRATGLANAIRAEYRVSLGSLDELAPGEPLGGSSSSLMGMAARIASRPFYSSARSGERLAELARAGIADLDKPYVQSELARQQADRTGTSPFRLLLSGNVIGHILIDMLTPAWDRVLAVKSRDHVRHGATLLVLALKVHHAEHGRLPDQLEELVPRHLPAVPLDDFDGQPLRYSKAERRIHSVGTAILEPGGTEEPHAQGALEFTFPIGF